MTQIDDPDQLCAELERRHPIGFGLKLGDVLIKMLQSRGRDVMPYVRSKLAETVGGWQGDSAAPFVSIAEQNGWWDLWAATIRADRQDKRFNAAVAKLTEAGRDIPDDERMSRLQALAGDDLSKIPMLIAIAAKITREEGFRLNRQKTRVLRRGQRQRVTGVVVNDQLGLSRSERRRLRAAIHQLGKDAKQDATTRKRLAGKIAYVRMLNPSQAEPLQKSFAVGRN